jgi:hypothetical protein
VFSGFSAAKRWCTFSPTWERFLDHPGSEFITAPESTIPHIRCHRSGVSDLVFLAAVANTIFVAFLVVAKHRGSDFSLPTSDASHAYSNATFYGVYSPGGSHVIFRQC